MVFIGEFIICVYLFYKGGVVDRCFVYWVGENKQYEVVFVKKVNKKDLVVFFFKDEFFKDQNYIDIFIF